MVELVQRKNEKKFIKAQNTFDKMGFHNHYKKELNKNLQNEAQQ